jgi:hypothetical protein
MTGKRALVGLLMFGLMATMLAGCGSKVSKDNYEKVKAGMTLAEVEGILGKGTEKAGVGGALGNLAGSAKVVEWKDGDKSITATFLNDKMTTKIQTGL